MFQPLGGNAISVVFNEEQQATTAKTSWKNQSSAQCRVLSMNRRSPSKKKGGKLKSKGMGFAAKMDAAMSTETGPFKIPEKCELAIFVSPGPKELNIIYKECETLGMDTLIILLNARLDSINNFGSDEASKLFKEDFESIFNLSAASQDDAPGCLLYRAFPGEWVLARKPKVGLPKVIGRSEVRIRLYFCELYSKYLFKLSGEV